MDAVKSDDAVQQFEALVAELKGLPPHRHSAKFVSWELRTRSALTHALGAQHHITDQFNHNRWTSVSWGDEEMEAGSFGQGAARAQGMLDAAIAEVKMLGDDVPVADEEGIDAELWEHVAPEIRSEAWVKAARGALIFTEDRIRRWAGRPDAEAAKELAVAIFGDKGNYRMGRTDGEMQGWQLFAQGIAQALRNADTHRIQERPDLKRYALGVVGACSLLLTQMRFEHENRLKDTSPATSTEGQPQ
jgi:hypothetical protein